MAAITSGHFCLQYFVENSFHKLGAEFQNRISLWLN